MWVAFAKATHIFSPKILAYMPYLMIKVLTIRKLKTSLVLNNWTLKNSIENIARTNEKHVSSPLYVPAHDKNLQ